MTACVTTLAVLRELRRGEHRVAVVPAEAPKLRRPDCRSCCRRVPATRPVPDQDYAALEGVRVVAGRAEALDAAQRGGRRLPAHVR